MSPAGYRDFADSSAGTFSSISFAQSSRAARILATSMKKFMPIAQKKDRRLARRLIDVEGRHRDPGAGILDAVGQRIGQLQVRRRAGFLHVIAGNRDRIELRHVLRREA